MAAADDETALERLRKFERRLLLAGGNLDATGIPYVRIRRCPACEGHGECAQCRNHGVIADRYEPDAARN
jgi:hypothetical protein